jgi:predicted metal-dependent peptidase|tara:strand:+ start:1099 stop:2370 length:1272 start_codon:yes stop_codon:yes gene_type:complete
MLNIGKQLSAEERLSKAVVKIMDHPRYTALAGVLMLGEKTIEEDIPTACTNGRDVKYGRAFVDGLTDAELRGLVLHEDEGHKLYRHLTTWRWMYDIDPFLANCACDYVINIRIVDDNKDDGFAELPEGGLVDERFRGMDEAQVFNILRQEQDEQSTGDSGGSDSQDNESGDGDPQDNESGSGSEQSAGAGLDQHDWDGAQELSDEEKRELARDIDEAIRQGAMAAGKMGGTGNRGLDELLQPQVDWREVLREFVQTTCAGSDYSTYARPNRRLMSQGIYMPSGVSEQVEELVIAIDTSGSIGQSELTEFLSEVKGVCDTVKPNKVRLLYWGSDVVGDESYDMHELDNLVTSTKPMGGGGTDVNCVTQYMAKKGIKPQAVIVLTDGHLYGGWGEWTCPVLWTILDNERALADVGKTVHIKSRDM